MNMRNGSNGPNAGAQSTMQQRGYASVTPTQMTPINITARGRSRMDLAANFQTYDGKGAIGSKRLSSLEMPSSALAATKSTVGPYKPSDGMRHTQDFQRMSPKNNLVATPFEAQPQRASMNLQLPALKQSVNSANTSPKLDFRDIRRGSALAKMTSGEVRIESGAKNKIGTPNLLLQYTDTKFYDSDRHHHNVSQSDYAGDSNGDLTNRSPQTHRKAAAKHMRNKTESCAGFNNTQMSGQFKILEEAQAHAQKAFERNKSVRKGSLNMTSQDCSKMSLRETVLMGSKKHNRVGGIEGYEMKLWNHDIDKPVAVKFLPPGRPRSFLDVYMKQKKAVPAPTTYNIMKSIESKSNVITSKSPRVTEAEEH